MDNLTKAVRFRVMSSNKSRGTKSTEQRFRSFLIRSGTCGWRLGHGTDLPGGPDFIFPKEHVAVFIDGCFWHGCRKCRSIPATNRGFWSAKIRENRRRDRLAVKALRVRGWTALRVWEHELKHGGDGALRKLSAVRTSSRRRT